MQKSKGITSTEEITEGNTQRIAKENCTLAAFFCNRDQLLEAL
jgi:hypothetical protein